MLVRCSRSMATENVLLVATAPVPVACQVPPSLTPRRIRNTLTEEIGCSRHGIQVEFDVKRALMLSFVDPVARSSTIIAIPVEDSQDRPSQVSPPLSLWEVMAPPSL